MDLRMSETQASTESKVFKEEFLQVIFKGLHKKPLEQEHIAVCPTRRSTQLSSEQRLTSQNFFCVSTVNGETVTKVNQTTGEEYTYPGRTRKNLVAAYCFVLDDIGTKAKAPEVVPHWVIETSPGNEQWGYIIHDEDMSHLPTLEFYEACISALISAGYSDPGAIGAYRIMRLPGSRKEAGGHKAICTQWRPDMDRYDLDALMKALRIEPLFSERKAAAQIANEEDTDMSFAKWVAGLTGEYMFLGTMSRQVRDLLLILKDIPSDVEYSDWLKIGMALKTLPNEQFGYRVFYKWSAQGQKFNPDEWPDKWESFTKGDTSRDVGLTTIFYIGKKLGIDPPTVDLPEASELFREMNNRAMFVSEGKGSRVVVLPGLLDKMVTPDIKWEWHSLHNFRDDFGTLRTMPIDPTDPPQGKVPQRWIDHSYRRRYSGVQLAAPPNEPNANQLNLWQGFAVEAADGPIPLFLKHITEVLGAESEECGEYLMRFFAWAIQNPGSVPGVMLVLKGGRGVGKSMVSDAFRTIFGAHGVLIDHDDGLTGRFNKQLEGALWVSLEEAGWAGDKKGQGKLKSLITSKTVMIEPKGVDPYQVANGAKFLLTTNHDWAVPAAGDERRFAVFEVGDQYKQDRKYFGPLRQEIKKGLGDILGHFLSYKLPDGWHPGDHIPQTLALESQQDQSAVVSESYVRAFLAAELAKADPFHDRLRMDQRLHADPYGEGLIKRDEEVPVVSENDRAVYWIPQSWLNHEVQEFVRRTNHYVTLTPHMVTKQMKHLLPEIGKPRQIRGEVVRGWRLPKAETVREFLGIAEDE